jgi:hypothetical protein
MIQPQDMASYGMISRGDPWWIIAIPELLLASRFSIME